jgi:mono/diheme cytochrome c family protein
MRILPPVFCSLLAASAWAQTPAPAEFFEKKIRPVLAANCQTCHNAKMKVAGLDLTSAEGFTQGGQSGPIVVAGNPEASRLLKVITYNESMKMPPTGKLKEEEIADLGAWVKSGAVWPGAAAVPSTQTVRQSPREITAAEKSFWAFQPVRDPAVPAVKDQSWIRTPIDRFILAKLEEKSLKPAPPANKAALLRRATFDLTGLPPTEKETRDFLADKSKDAFRNVVERLLASPRYGERWGRHWLDVARYADSTGNDEDHRYPYAWRYRDYVIDAFNHDMPYDQFVREQVAGDLLPSSDGKPINGRGIVATGLLALGPKALAQKDKVKMLYDIYDEQVDVVSKAFMGLTVSCARCHDHKFDPILTKDYYSLVGIFASTRDFNGAGTGVSKMLFRPLAPQAEYEQWHAYERKLAQAQLSLEDVLDREREKYIGQLSPRLADFMIAARRVYKDNAALADVAREKNLREDVLRKWVEYLKPAPFSRPYLNEWQSAAEDKLAEAAKGYQTRFEERAEKWGKTLGAYRARSRKMLAAKNMPPPNKPEFDAATDPFFYDVYFESGPFAIPEKEEGKLFSPAALDELAKLKKEVADLKQAAPPEPAMACAVEEGDPVNQKVFIRGDYNSPGEDAPKAFPKILTISAPQQQEITSGSGRLGLAEWLSKPNHPLTARVMVNRIWEWHFGEGLVRTPDNFGKMGERPTHPELLDYLASRFTAGGWSIKAMHRAIMLSGAYQMASQADERTLEADPENRLFSRFNRRRLDIEEIRDGMLALDGTLDLTMGGTLQKGFGTDKENSSDRLSLNPEKLRRRTVYVPLRRSNLPTLLNLFDFGDATTVTGKRPLTNVAPQALFMMNSDFVGERAMNLAQSLAKREPAPPRRMESAYRTILNRAPSPAEADGGLTYIASFRKKFEKASELDAWQSFCRILLASDDYIYVD